jgi:hypothetical protein
VLGVDIASNLVEAWKQACKGAGPRELQVSGRLKHQNWTKTVSSSTSAKQIFTFEFPARGTSL